MANCLTVSVWVCVHPGRKQQGDGIKGYRLLPYCFIGSGGGRWLKHSRFLTLIKISDRRHRRHHLGLRLRRHVCGLHWLNCDLNIFSRQDLKSKTAPLPIKFPRPFLVRLPRQWRPFLRLRVTLVPGQRPLSAKTSPVWQMIAATGRWEGSRWLEAKLFPNFDFAQ